MAYVRCNGQCSRAFGRFMANLVRDLQYWGVPTWVLWLLLAGCIVAVITLVVQLRRPYRRPLQRRTRQLRPIPPVRGRTPDD